MVTQFLAAHPKLHLHFAPSYSSWLNQVELWFAKIERDGIAGVVFTSIKDWRASSCATSVITTSTPRLSNGPTATTHIEPPLLLLIQLLQVTS
jgi:hypothetical protein